jgi:hypothetical protein
MTELEHRFLTMCNFLTDEDRSRLISTMAGVIDHRTPRVDVDDPLSKWPDRMQILAWYLSNAEDRLGRAIDRRTRTFNGRLACVRGEAQWVATARLSLEPDIVEMDEEEMVLKAWVALIGRWYSIAFNTRDTLSQISNNHRAEARLDSAR